MEFRILGPLEVVDRGRRLPLGGSKQRALLAVLLLQANQVVSYDRLLDALWGARSPATARAAVQVYVSQLRKLLGPARILTRPAGYLLRVEPEELDLARAEQLMHGDGEDRAGRLRRALTLWRGPALVDFHHEPFAQAEIARLEELRLAAVEERIEDDLALGRHRELIGELEALVCQHPLRERLRAQLMLALYRCGRQAEALALCSETRRLLVEDLGVDLGPELQLLERRILNQDPALAPPPPAPAAMTPTSGEAAPPWHEERKVVSVLFAEVVRFAFDADELDLEDVHALRSPQLERLHGELQRHGGTVEYSVGDTVMAFFGAPVTHEDDADRAVRAALAVRDWIAEQGQDLSVRIAVNTGEALVRIGAHPTDGEGIAVGEVVNTAARLKQLAPSGGVVVSEATYVATRHSIHYQPLGPVELEGRPKPLALWLAKQARSRLVEQLAGSAAMPFVGRDADLALLEQTCARTLRASSIQLVTIVGAAGVGKTRLVAEFRRSLEQRDDTISWRYGRCLPYGEGITFWALGEVVKAQAGILESDTSGATSAKLAAAVEAAIDQESDREWVARLLAPLVDTARPGAEATDRSEAFSEAFSAWRMFLEGIAAKRPLLIVLEDLHWADPPLLQFVEELVDWSRDVPLLVVCTARPELYERAPGWGGGKRNSITISLPSLSDEETARLVSALLYQAVLPAPTHAALLERSGGNPLYAEEFVGMLGDGGLLQGPGAVEQTPDTEIPVPGTVQAVIAARLDTLPLDRKALLYDAAVVGKVFWAGAVAAIGRLPREEVLEGLRGLERKELVRRARASSIADDVEYTFWHVLVRDVAYAQIPRAVRARKHVAAAEWIERITAERVRDRAELLAHHYATGLELARGILRADEVTALEEPAVRFLTLAGERALRLDQARGERYYRQALQLLPTDDPRRPVVLARTAGAAILGAGTGFDEIKHMLEEAIAALRAQGDVTAAADAMRQLSYAMFKPGGQRADLRYQLADEARRLLERVPAGPELALCYARIAQEHAFAARGEEMLEWAGKALPLLQRYHLDDEALHMRSMRAVQRCDLGDLGGIDEQRDVLRDALDPARGYGTTAAIHGYNNLQTSVFRYGDGPAEALGLLRALGELATRRGAASAYRRCGPSAPGQRCSTSLATGMTSCARPTQ